LLLLSGILQKNHELLRDLLRGGVDVLTPFGAEAGLDPSLLGTTPLLLAVRRGTSAIAVELMRAGATLADDARPLLAEAIDAGWDLESVRALVACGADPSEEAQNGLTPLIAARLNDRQDLVTLLLDRGAPDPAFLGVARCYDGALTARVLRECGLEQGAVVAAVAETGPAQLAGIRAHDVLVAIDARPVAAFSDVSRLISAELVGAALTCTVARQRETMNVAVRLQSRPWPVRYVGLASGDEGELDFDDADE